MQCMRLIPLWKTRVLSVGRYLKRRLLFAQNLDLLKVVQGEVQGCVTELDKLKKIYVDDEHVSHDARDKAREAEEK